MKIICRVCKEFKENYAKGLCQDCYNKKYRASTVKKRKLYNKKYKKENSIEIKIYNKKWRENNLDYYKKYGKAYKRKHGKAYQRKYYAENSEKMKLYSKKYRLENPEKRRELKLKRRGYGIVKKGVVDKIITENILKYGSIICEKCKEKCPDNFHIDHIIPISKRGSNNYDNLQILCAHCNLSKKVKIMDYREPIQNQQLYLK